MLKGIFASIICLSLNHCYSQRYENTVKIEIKIPRIFYSSYQPGEKPRDFRYKEINYDREYYLTSGTVGNMPVRELFKIKTHELHPDDTSGIADFEFETRDVTFPNFANRPAPFKLLDQMASEIPNRFSLWNAELPVWYTVSITPKHGDQKISFVNTYHQAVKTFQIWNGITRLNGSIIKLKKVRYVGGFDDIAKIAADIAIIKKSNINCVIVEKYDERWLKLCDSLGVYTIIEHNIKNPKNCKNVSECREYYREINYVNTKMMPGNTNHLNYGSLLFFFTTTGDKILISGINDLLYNFNRYPKNFYHVSELKTENLSDVPTFYGDSAVHTNSNRLTINTLLLKYQPVAIKINNVSTGEITIENKFDFIDVKGLVYSWILTKNGEVIATNKIEVSSLPPNKNMTFKLFDDLKSFYFGYDYALKLWATYLPKEVASYSVLPETFKFGVLRVD